MSLKMADRLAKRASLIQINAHYVIKEDETI
jgi:hypothetical protein